MKSNRKYSKSQINKAGKFLKDREKFEEDKIEFAESVLTYWRTIHAPLLNTFQANLRQRITRNYRKKGVVAQRLKRSESIVGKLKRIRTMKLSTMQDIAGIRAIMNIYKDVISLYQDLLRSKSKHNLISSNDYITNPKESGYRGIHLIFEYINEALPESSNLKIEVQLRSRLQHIWATSVETMGTFLDISLKSSEGPKEILSFFSLVSSGFAILEKAPIISTHSLLSNDEIFNQIIEQYDSLNIKDKLNAFRVAANHINTRIPNAKFYIIRLDLDKKKVNVYPYKKQFVEIANIQYTKFEKEIVEKNLNQQVVLVSIESIKSLKKAYPNYFLESVDFIKKIEEIRRRTMHTRS